MFFHINQTEKYSENVIIFMAFLVGFIFMNGGHLYIFELLCFISNLGFLCSSILTNTLHIHALNVCLFRTLYFCDIFIFIASYF